MKRTDTIVVGGIFGFSIIFASFLVSQTDNHHAVASAPAAPVVTVAAAMHMSAVIATPGMLGTEVGPALIPGNISLPAHTNVTITITNFDDATALAPGTEKYATAQGTIGPISVQPMDPGNPNAAAPVTKTMSLDPATGVSHTFTIAKLGINVPIAPKSRTTFTIHTTGAGTYEWQCFDPCGGDPNGWGGAMAKDGYMKGTVQVCGNCGGGSACC